MVTINLSLSERMKAWVERQVEGGRYDDASDYVRDQIRRDQERKEAVTVLQAAIDDGIASGEPEPFDAAVFKRRMRERHAAR